MKNMLNWRKRIAEWRAVMVQATDGAPLRWRGKFYALSAFKMVRALASGPVPMDVWRTRMRVCLRCPILDRETFACRKPLADGRLLGCSCFTPFLALTAAPYKAGCWVRAITDNEGWPAFTFPSWRAKATAVFRFIVPTLAAWRPRMPHFHVWREIFPAHRPSRSDWHCWLRHCRCGRVEFKAYEILGDKKWHDVHDRKACMWQSEHDGIIESARHYKLMK